MKAHDRPSCRSLPGIWGGVRERRLVVRLDFAARQPSPPEQLAARLLARAMRTFPEPHFNRPIKRAIREALELAEQSGYPLLLLPELFSELAIAAMLKSEYQRLGRL